MSRGSARRSSSRSILRSVGREIRDNPPAVLSSTRRKFGAERANKQRTAILLNKSRKAGAAVPPPPKE